MTTIISNVLSPLGVCVYNNNCSSHQCGVSILLSPRFLRDYSPTIVDIPNKYKGTLIHAHCTPTADSALPTITLSNLHLRTGTDFIKARIEQLTELTRLAAADYNYVGGDFNFVETAEDTTAATVYAPRPAFLKAWTTFLNHFNLHEVHQPTHTCHSVSVIDPTTSVSSRHDRIYISHSEAERAIVQPHSFLPAIPVSLHTAYRGG